MNLNVADKRLPAGISEAASDREIAGTLYTTAGPAWATFLMCCRMVPGQPMGNRKETVNQVLASRHGPHREHFPKDGNM